MTADSEAVPSPQHPMYALTTFELHDYRRQREHAISALPGHATIREQFQQRLAEVLTEQDACTRLQHPDRP